MPTRLASFCSEQKQRRKLTAETNHIFKDSPICESRMKTILDYPNYKSLYHHVHDKYILNVNLLWKKYKCSFVFSLPAALYCILPLGRLETRITLKINPFLWKKQRHLQWVNFVHLRFSVTVSKGISARFSVPT